MRRLVPLALVLLAACSTATGEGLGLRELSERLPVLRGSTLTGGELTPADYRGDVVVVNFWATWCGPCRREQPALQRLWEEFSGRGVSFVGVNYRDDPAAAREYLREFDVTYPSLEDPAGAYADDFGFVGLPDTYLADRTGTMRYAVIGPIGEESGVDEDDLRGLIEELLADPS